MSTDLRQTYLERDVLESDGCRLVVLLYESALQTIQQAREHLNNGDIRLRSQAITRSSEIFNELAQTVDHDAGGEIARNLVELYDYLQSLLIQANTGQVEAPLIEAASLVETLLDAWRTCDTSATSSPPQSIANTAAAAEYAPVDCIG